MEQVERVILNAFVVSYKPKFFRKNFKFVLSCCPTHAMKYLEFETGYKATGLCDIETRQCPMCQNNSMVKTPETENFRCLYCINKIDDLTDNENKFLKSRLLIHELD